MILEDYIKELQNLVEKYPQTAKMPVIYSSDDEGNAYHDVNYTATLAKADDLEEYYIEIESTYNPDQDESCSFDEINCIIIN